MRARVVLSGTLEDGRILVGFNNGFRQGFFMRFGVGFLTNACK